MWGIPTQTKGYFVIKHLSRRRALRIPKDLPHGQEGILLRRY